MFRRFAFVLLAAAMFAGTRSAFADFQPGPGGSGYPHLTDGDGPGNGGGYAVTIATPDDSGCGGYNGDAQ